MTGRKNKKTMNYAEAIKKSLTVKWVIGACPTGEECWCRVVKCDPPLMYREREEDSDEEEYWPIRSGEVGRETVEHIVEAHNRYINEKFDGLLKLGEVDDVAIYYDKHHPDQTLTVDYDEKLGIMKYIIGPYDDISIYDGIKKTVRVSSEPVNMIRENETWEEIEEDYLKDEYPVFGGPFTNARTPFEWLKQYFNSPKRK